MAVTARGGQSRLGKHRSAICPLTLCEALQADSRPVRWGSKGFQLSSGSAPSMLSPISSSGDAALPADPLAAAFSCFGA